MPAASVTHWMRPVDQPHEMCPRSFVGSNSLCWVQLHVCSKAKSWVQLDPQEHSLGLMPCAKSDPVPAPGSHGSSDTAYQIWSCAPGPELCASPSSARPQVLIQSGMQGHIIQLRGSPQVWTFSGREHYLLWFLELPNFQTHGALVFSLIMHTPSFTRLFWWKDVGYVWENMVITHCGLSKFVSTPYSKIIIE